ncbi:MAG: peptidylprolyl isomerase [Verrucomicrobiota bacterium]
MTEKKILRTLALVLVSAANLARSDSAPPSHSAVVATLAGEPIRLSEFDAYVQGGWATAGSDQVRANQAVRQETLQSFLDLKVMAAKAREDGIDKTTNFQKAAELMDMKMLVHLVVEHDRAKFTSAFSVPDRELRAYYDQHADEFLVTPNFTCRQILVYVKGNPAFPDKGLDDAAAKAKAGEALAKLRAGESWQMVAKNYSDDVITRQRGGLIKEAQFGYLPPEVEVAIRNQELSKPGDVVQYQFGYHVLQVEQRTLEGEREPFDKAKEKIAGLLSQAGMDEVRRRYMTALQTEIGLKKTALASNDVPLQLSLTGDQNGVLATIGQVAICESDFAWFLKDAFRPEQRAYVFNRPGARQQLLNSYLHMRTLEAKARKDGLDQQPSFRSQRAVMEMKLLAEFLQERDRSTPWALPGKNEPERQAAFEKYIERLRGEMDLKWSSP